MKTLQELSTYFETLLATKIEEFLKRYPENGSDFEVRHSRLNNTAIKFYMRCSLGLFQDYIIVIHPNFTVETYEELPVIKQIIKQCFDCKIAYHNVYFGKPYNSIKQLIKIWANSLARSTPPTIDDRVYIYKLKLTDEQKLEYTLEYFS